MFVALLIAFFVYLVRANTAAVLTLGGLLVLALVIAVTPDVGEFMLKMVGIEARVTRATSLDEAREDIARSVGLAVADVPPTVTATDVAMGSIDIEQESQMITDPAAIEVLETKRRTAIEDATAAAMKAGYIAAQTGWKSIPQPHIEWNEDGEPSVLFMSGNPQDRALELAELNRDIVEAQARLASLPEIEPGEGPHLPWYRDRMRTENRLADLMAKRNALTAGEGNGS